MLKMTKEQKEHLFKSEMARAQTLRDLENDHIKRDYWDGYIRGLRRGYHGEIFGTAAEHSTYWNLYNSPDKDREARGRGYRGGISFFSPRGKGRPGKGPTHMLFNVRIPKDLYARMERCMMYQGIDLDVFRTAAYEHYCCIIEKQMRGNSIDASVSSVSNQPGTDPLLQSEYNSD